MHHDEDAPAAPAGPDRPGIDPATLEPGAEIVVNGRRLTVAMVVPRRSGWDIAPTCGAPVSFDPATDEPIRHQPRRPAPGGPTARSGGILS